MKTNQSFILLPRLHANGTNYVRFRKTDIWILRADLRPPGSQEASLKLMWRLPPSAVARFSAARHSHRKFLPVPSDFIRRGPTLSDNQAPTKSSGKGQKGQLAAPTAVKRDDPIRSDQGVGQFARLGRAGLIGRAGPASEHEHLLDAANRAHGHCSRGLQAGAGIRYSGCIKS